MSVVSKLLCIFLLLCSCSSVMAKGDLNDGTVEPVGPPPESRIMSVSLAILKVTNALELVFLVDVAPMELEIFDASNTCIVREKSGVQAYSSLIVDTRGWKGCYTIVLRMPQKTEQFRVEYK